MPGQVDRGKQQIAHFLGQCRTVIFGHGFEYFVELFAHLVQHRQGIRPVETDLGRAFLQLGGPGQGRQGGRHVIEQRQLLGNALLGPFLGLYFFPALLDLGLVEFWCIQRRV
ncbi:hypothetical protein D3C78_1143780 [compost metagenome]